MGVPVFISYEEAQELIPVFEFLAKASPYPEATQDAKVILSELKDVRNLDYSPLPGKQVFLTQRQKTFLEDSSGITL